MEENKIITLKTLNEIKGEPDPNPVPLNYTKGMTANDLISLKYWYVKDPDIYCVNRLIPAGLINTSIIILTGTPAFDNTNRKIYAGTLLFSMYNIPFFPTSSGAYIKFKISVMRANKIAKEFNQTYSFKFPSSNFPMSWDISDLPNGNYNIKCDFLTNLLYNYGALINKSNALAISLTPSGSIPKLFGTIRIVVGRSNNMLLLKTLVVNNLAGFEFNISGADIYNKTTVTSCMIRIHEDVSSTNSTYIKSFTNYNFSINENAYTLFFQPNSEYHGTITVWYQVRNKTLNFPIEIKNLDPSGTFSADWI